MGIRTGKGDKGFTSLLFHKRVSKDSLHVRAIGDLDELNSYLGLIKSKIRPRKERAALEILQRAVSTITSETAVSGEKKKKLGHLLSREDVHWAESFLYELEQRTKVKEYFYVPGASEVSAFIDIARAVSRRAERSVVALFRKEKIRNDNILAYLNCLSDILFVLAREKSQGKKTPAKKRSVRRKKTKSKGKR
jgi:cob(I)alamin adenosyltransferase